MYGYTSISVKLYRYKSDDDACSRRCMISPIYRSSCIDELYTFTGILVQLCRYKSDDDACSTRCMISPVYRSSCIDELYTFTGILVQLALTTVVTVTDNCILTSASLSVWGLRMWPDLLFSIAHPHGQPHSVFGVFISISGGWMMLCKEFIMAEDSLYITMQRITIF